MDQNPLRVAVALLYLACTPASADVLYKWTGPNGVVKFSNLPPDTSRSDERLQAYSVASGSEPAVQQDMLSEEKLRAVDPEVQRASLLMDSAERALAVARRPMWTKPDPGRLGVQRMTRVDADRIDFHKRNFIAARQALFEVLKQRRSAPPQTLTASLDSPIARP